MTHRYFDFQELTSHDSDHLSSACGVEGFPSREAIESGNLSEVEWSLLEKFAKKRNNGRLIKTKPAPAQSADLAATFHAVIPQDVRGPFQVYASQGIGGNASHTCSSQLPAQRDGNAGGITATTDIISGNRTVVPTSGSGEAQIEPISDSQSARSHHVVGPFATHAANAFSGVLSTLQGVMRPASDGRLTRRSNSDCRSIEVMTAKAQLEVVRHMKTGQKFFVDLIIRGGPCTQYEARARTFNRNGSTIEGVEADFKIGLEYIPGLVLPNMAGENADLCVVDIRLYEDSREALLDRLKVFTSNGTEPPVRSGGPPP